MSRSGYGEGDDSDYPIDLYRNAVDRALNGKRGQAFLREMATALDAMPVKELIAEELLRADGACCALGAVCKARAMDVSRLDYFDPWVVGKHMGIATAMAAEIEYMNDEFMERRAVEETNAERWTRMRKWVADKIVAETPNAPAHRPARGEPKS